MIKITNIETSGWEAAIRGMRNPMNSWEKSDSNIYVEIPQETDIIIGVDQNGSYRLLGDADASLMLKLALAGSDHAKYRRMINVTMDVLAPLYWWKEFDTYKVGTVANSTSSMHSIYVKKFEPDDFSHEHLTQQSKAELIHVIGILNGYRKLYLKWDDLDDNTKNAYLGSVYDGANYNRKDAWWQIIQLLPSSYNQLRTVQLNYEVLSSIYKARKDHKLDEWREFCKMIETLPYSDIITLVSKGG